MPNVVTRHTRHVAQAHGVQWLGAVERLDLRLCVDAVHDRLAGPILIKANDAAELLYKERIAGVVLQITVSAAMVRALLWVLRDTASTLLFGLGGVLTIAVPVTHDEGGEEIPCEETFAVLVGRPS